MSWQLLWWSSGWDFTLPLQGTVVSLILSSQRTKIPLGKQCSQKKLSWETGRSHYRSAEVPLYLFRYLSDLVCHHSPLLSEFCSHYIGFLFFLKPSTQTVRHTIINQSLCSQPSPCSLFLGYFEYLSSLGLFHLFIFFTQILPFLWVYPDHHFSIEIYPSLTSL